jgi:hypothetical protein
MRKLLEAKSIMGGNAKRKIRNSKSEIRNMNRSRSRKIRNTKYETGTGIKKYETG